MADPAGATPVSLWKTSRRGAGAGHLRRGYLAHEFPAVPVGMVDGCAYFARDRWIAEQFANPLRAGYEDFMIEVQISVDVYEREFLQFERRLVLADCEGVELAIPASRLDVLNRFGVRFVHQWR